MSTEVHINSEYGFWPYVIAVLFFLFMALVPVAIASCIIVGRGVVLRRFEPTTIHMKVLSGFLFFSVTCLSVAIGFAEGFWVIHTALAAFLDVFVWVVVAPVACLLGGPNVRIVLNPAGQTFGTSPDRAAAASRANAAGDLARQTSGANGLSEEEEAELDLLKPGLHYSPSNRGMSAVTSQENIAGGGGLRIDDGPSSNGGESPSPSLMPPRALSAQTLTSDQPPPATPASPPLASRDSTTTKFLNTSQAATPKRRSPHTSGLQDTAETPFFTDTEAAAAASAAASGAADDPMMANLADEPAAKRFFKTLLFDLKHRPIVHAAALVAGLAGAAVLIMLLHNACVCNKPQTMTTWASRSTKTKLCPANGSPCHTYVMLGAECNTLTMVSHYVVADGFIPDQVRAEYCIRSPTNGACAGSWMTQGGVLRDNANLIEDERYIAHVQLSALQCGTAYNVKVFFTSTSSTASVASPIVCTHTTPRATPIGPGTNGVPAVSFIGGGDYVVKAEGKALLQRAMAVRPNASFVFIGGDLGYANNMRTCYRRVDEMLVEFAEVLRYPSDQCIVPLAVAMGNHDAGGYQWAGASAYATAAGRAAHSAFYSRYYPQTSVAVTPTPSEDAHANDWTTTLGTRVIGGVLGWTTLDTGHVLGLTANQVGYFRQAMTYMRDTARVPSVVLYHVPGFPSVRSSDGSSSTGTVESDDVRNAFGPILDEFDDVVSLVFENHDHAYKRTHRLRGGAVVAPTGPGGRPQLRQRGRGVVYTGDGALGANDPADEAVVAGGRGAKTQSTNYVITADILTNGSIVVQSLRPDGSEIDAFVAV